MENGTHELFPYMWFYDDDITKQLPEWVQKLNLETVFLLLVHIFVNQYSYECHAMLVSLPRGQLNALRLM